MHFCVFNVKTELNVLEAISFLYGGVELCVELPEYLEIMRKIMM